MWEAIRANQRRSRLLIVLMAGLLVTMGAVAAGGFAGPDMAWVGALMALGVWGCLLLVARFQGDSLALMAAGARPLAKEDAPVLWNITEEMTIAAGLGQMPRIYLIDDDSPNAFATASRKGPAAIAVTAGLLRRLNRDELQGVIAHEIGHIRNRDVQFMTLALILVGSIALVADMALRMLWFGGGRRRGGNSKGNGQAQMILLVLTLVAAILAPLFARLLYFAVSRQREYLADASSARFTRYPLGLASALEKIAGSQTGSRGHELRALAPMYIVNPLAAASTGLLASHPPTKRRVDILRAMGGGAGWVDYEKAYGKIVGDRTPCLNKDTLTSEDSVAARAASAGDAPREQAMDRAREVTDLVDRLAHFILIPCLCGVRIKVPPGFKGDGVDCPRCGRKHDVPHAEPATPVAAAAAAATGVASDAGTSRGPTSYRRQGKSWESFRCACGRVQQLSPAFSGQQVRCASCRRDIEILPA
jgi:heat shock protein HtpX